MGRDFLQRLVNLPAADELIQLSAAFWSHDSATATRGLRLLLVVVWGSFVAAVILLLYFKQRKRVLCPSVTSGKVVLHEEDGKVCSQVNG